MNVPSPGESLYRYHSSQAVSDCLPLNVPSAGSFIMQEFKESISRLFKLLKFGMLALELYIKSTVTFSVCSSTQQIFHPRAGGSSSKALPDKIFEYSFWEVFYRVEIHVMVFSLVKPVNMPCGRLIILSEYKSRCVRLFKPWIGMYLVL